jgi:hypothetical protein
MARRYCELFGPRDSLGQTIGVVTDEAGAASKANINPLRSTKR